MLAISPWLNSVLHRQDTGKSKGHGFVTFVEGDAAQRALLNTTPVVDGRKIMVKLAVDGLAEHQAIKHQQQAQHLHSQAAAAAYYSATNPLASLLVQQGVSGGLPAFGVQGVSGLAALQGLQGIQGLHGLQGLQTLQGLQGIQGMVAALPTTTAAKPAATQQQMQGQVQPQVASQAQPQAANPYAYYYAQQR
jgi:hypothetical protein